MTQKYILSNNHGKKISCFWTEEFGVNKIWNRKSSWLKLDKKQFFLYIVINSLIWDQGRYSWKQLGKSNKMKIYSITTKTT